MGSKVHLEAWKDDPVLSRGEEQSGVSLEVDRDEAGQLEAAKDLDRTAQALLLEQVDGLLTCQKPKPKAKAKPTTLRSKQKKTRTSEETSSAGLRRLVLQTATGLEFARTFSSGAASGPDP